MAPFNLTGHLDGLSLNRGVFKFKDIILENHQALRQVAMEVEQEKSQHWIICHLNSDKIEEILRKKVVPAIGSSSDADADGDSNTIEPKVASSDG